MQFDKSQIIDLLKQQGNDQKAQEAQQKLPDKVDPEKDSGLLSQLGIDPQEIISKLAGGGLGKLLG